MSIDYEEIYRLAFEKRWAELLDIVHKHSKVAASDEMIQRAVGTFEDYFFLQFEPGGGQELAPYLKKLFALHVGGIYRLPEDRFRLIVLELVSLYRLSGDVFSAYDCAKFYAEHPACAEVIAAFEANQPKIVAHSQSQQINVAEMPVASEIDHTTSLFKSQQEIDFFLALRDVFPMYTVYPNVALSTVISYSGIKAGLSGEEKDYFFKGIVDSVVVDHHDNYKPVFFFELDSAFHDIEERRRKDELKNRIVGLAGKKLYRIRRIARKQGKAEFVKLIREIFE